MPEKRITRVEFPARTFSPEQPPPTKRVAAYARVSTMKDAQENSLQAQQEYFTEYIQRHPGWVFAGMYSDDGISGLSIRERDGFNSMVTDALDGKIDLILTKSLSRFARNTVEALTTIRSLKAAGVAVYFQKENINTMDSTGEFLITLMSSFAEEESRSISENVTWAVRHRYAQGIYHLPGLLLGYQRIQDGEIQVQRFRNKVLWSVQYLVHFDADYLFSFQSIKLMLEFTLTNFNMRCIVVVNKIRATRKKYRSFSKKRAITPLSSGDYRNSTGISAAFIPPVLSRLRQMSATYVLQLYFDIALHLCYDIARTFQHRRNHMEKFIP